MAVYCTELFVFAVVAGIRQDDRWGIKATHQAERRHNSVQVLISATMQIFVPVLLLAIAAVAYGRVAEPVNVPEEATLQLCAERTMLVLYSARCRLSQLLRCRLCARCCDAGKNTHDMVLPMKALYRSQKNYARSSFPQNQSSMSLETQNIRAYSKPLNGIDSYRWKKTVGIALEKIGKWLQRRGRFYTAEDGDGDDAEDLSPKDLKEIGAVLGKLAVALEEGKTLDVALDGDDASDYGIGKWANRIRGWAKQIPPAIGG